MPNTQTPASKTRFRFLRSRRFFVCAAIFSITGIWLFCGGAAGLAVSQARAALTQRDVDTAQDWLEIADWFHGRKAEIAFLKSRACRRTGDLEEARKWLDVALALGTDRGTVQRERILMSAQVGRMRDAEPWLSELLFNPGDDGREICEAFVTGYFLNEESQKADDLFATWIADFPEDSYPWIFKGKIYYRLDRFSLAEESYREALKRDPESSDALTGLGSVLLKQKRPEDALVQFRRCLKIHTDLNGPRVGAAKALIILGRSEEALRELNLVLAAEPDHDEALLKRGKIHMAAGRHEEAVKDLKNLCRLRTGGFEHRYQLALALRAAGRDKEASEHFEFAEKGKTALNWAEKTTSQYPADTADLGVRTEVARIYLTYGNPMTGLAQLSVILNEAPDNRQALEVLVAYYRECSEFDVSFVRLADVYQARIDSLPAQKDVSSNEETPAVPVVE